MVAPPPERSASADAALGAPAGEPLGADASTEGARCPSVAIGAAAGPAVFLPEAATPIGATAGCAETPEATGICTVGADGGAVGPTSTGGIAATLALTSLNETSSSSKGSRLGGGASLSEEPTDDDTGNGRLVTGGLGTNGALPIVGGGGTCWGAHGGLAGAGNPGGPTGPPAANGGGAPTDAGPLEKGGGTKGGAAEAGGGANGCAGAGDTAAPGGVPA